MRIQRLSSQQKLLVLRSAGGLLRLPLRMPLDGWSRYVLSSKPVFTSNDRQVVGCHPVTRRDEAEAETWGSTG